MIMSRTPFRISLFGGGTDYPAWYREHGGAVVGATINKYCYISYRHLPPFFEHRHRIVYSRIELPQYLDEVQHPAVRAILREYNIHDGVEIQHHGDLPARSGMGSSSSFTVGLLNAVRAHYGQASSAEFLAQEAIRIEQEVICEAVGSQDQVWAAYGGINMIRFHTDGRFEVMPVIMTAERRQELQSHLLLFFTRFSRNADVIAARKIENLQSRRAQLFCMHKMAEQAMIILQNPAHRIAEIGHLLHDSWRLKKELADCVTTEAIDQMYTAAMDAGALGGKLLGAGGGGFMLIFAEPHQHEAIRAALRDLIEVSFEIGSPGSRIVIYEPNGLGARSQWA
ncbi:MAG: kinase [Acidobacteriia bacterium]|nr:kinase [Terriglobia bacterium]